MALFNGLFEGDDERDIAFAQGYIDLFYPRNFEEAVDVIKHLLQRHAAVVNVSKLDEQQRFLDFMSGVTLATKGTMFKISKDVVAEALFVSPSNNPSISSLRRPTTSINPCGVPSK